MFSFKKNKFKNLKEDSWYFDSNIFKKVFAVIKIVHGLTLSDKCMFRKLSTVCEWRQLKTLLLNHTSISEKKG